jgi:hypothetical protein
MNKQKYFKMGNQLINLSDLQPTKAAASVMANQIAEIVESGNINPIDAAIKLNCIEVAVKEAKEKIQPTVLDALNLHAEKNISQLGAKIEKCEVAIKYDYSNDAKWKELAMIADAASTELKQHEDMLKRIPARHSIVDEVTGETFSAPAKSSKSSYKITLGK